MKPGRSILSASLILFGFLLSSSNGYGQTDFLVKIDVSGYDRGVGVEEIVGSGFVVTGYTTNALLGDQEVLLLRTDQMGDTLWTKSIGGPGLDNGWGVRQTDDGGFIIVGFTDSYGAGGMDVYLIRTDALGDTLWTKTFGGPEDEYGWDIRETVDGGFIIAAETGSFGSGELDAYLIKTDADGNEEWANFYGGDKTDRVFSVQQTPDSGYVAAGISYSYDSVGPNDRDAYLIKTDASGNLDWFETYGGDDYDVGHSVALTDDSGYVITGYGESFATNGTRDVYLIKTGADGQEQWTKVYGENVDERGITGLQTTDGGYVAVGFTDWNFDVYLVKADSAGDLLWTRTFGTVNRVDFGYTLQETSDGGLIIAGHTERLNGTRGNVLLIKTDNNGIITDVFAPGSDAPDSYRLNHNFPNPFNPKTVITYRLGETSDVELTVFDATGRRVQSLVRQEQAAAGRHSVTFDASGLASGVYLYTLETSSGYRETRKLVLLK